MFVLKGVYKRKEVQHADADAQLVRHLANTHPYNLRWDATHFADYARLYGQPEADTLAASVASGKYNMVESYNKAWVIGGVLVPEDPVPAPVPGPDEETLKTPWGTVIVKKATGAVTQQPAAGGLDVQQLEALLDKVVMACLERAGLVKMLILPMIIFAMLGTAMAQVNVSLNWDASDTASPPENPVKYKLYVCSDLALTTCTAKEAGTALTFGPLPLNHGSTTWFYATAWNYALAVDGTVSGAIQESEKSNILQVRAFAPPGNPKNNRIVVTQIGTASSGQVLLAKLEKR